MTKTVDITDVVKKRVRDLPPLPMVVHKLVATLGDERSCADDVMRVLSSDQALAGKVLKLVNSSFYGMSGQISTPSRAVVILGFAAIRNLAVGLNVAKFMSDVGADERTALYWDHSITAAAACRELAQRTGYPDPEEAFIAGLLHDIGQMVLEIVAPEAFTAVMAGPPEGMLAREDALIGIGHARAGQILLKHWRLPKPLCDAVRFHHAPPIFTRGDERLVSLVALADVFANVHGQVFERSITGDELVALVAAAGFDVAETRATLVAMDDHIAETREFLEIATDRAFASLPRTSVAGLRAAVICTDRVCMTWTDELLEHFGVIRVPMKEYFAGSEVDLVILDPCGITDEQLARMAPRLSAPELDLVLFDGDDGRVARALGRAVPAIPLAFSRGDLGAVGADLN